uniref:CD44 antigen n=1 Tax=Ornithorhynchus anatinus TaxID=9258 RepID=A0A6I8PC70_ORNAN
MTNFFWCATLGLCLVKLILAQIELNVTCRYAGVYHVEKNGRYSISRIEAEDLCKAFNCTLPTLEQMEKARKVGFQTCRYGFIDGHVVIPRITPNSLCAANNTGVYILPSNTSLYDTYCYNASAPEGVSCEPVTDLPSAFEGQITIGIVNPDGTRYTQKGEYRTHINETDPTLHPEDDGSSGSETNTQGSSTIIKTTYYSPDSYPDSDFYTTPSEWDMTSSPATTRTNEGRKDAEPTSAPRRRPQIPEWLIILASLLALALILAVCIAVNSRRRCGQKKKLVINRSNGAVEERKMSGLNGDASKSQEMVHLVNKEPSDERTGQDEFTVTDETRNLQNVDMKIGM